MIMTFLIFCVSFAILHHLRCMNVLGINVILTRCLRLSLRATWRVGELAYGELEAREKT